MTFVPQITFIILSNLYSPSKIKDYFFYITKLSPMMLVNISSETQHIDKVNSIKGRGNIVNIFCLRNPEITQLCYNFRIMQNASEWWRKKKPAQTFLGSKFITRTLEPRGKCTVLTTCQQTRCKEKKNHAGTTCNLFTRWCHAFSRNNAAAFAAWWLYVSVLLVFSSNQTAEDETPSRLNRQLHLNNIPASSLRVPHEATMTAWLDIFTDFRAV